MTADPGIVEARILAAVAEATGQAVWKIRQRVDVPGREFDKALASLKARGLVREYGPSFGPRYLARMEAAA